MRHIQQADGASKDITGVSHWYEPPGRDQPGGKDANGRYLYPYTMSYVRFEVKPGAEYMYKVKSGPVSAIAPTPFYKPKKCGASSFCPCLRAPGTVCT